MLLKSFILYLADADELIPQAGKDDVYDEIMAEVDGLEEEFEDELKKLEKKLGCDQPFFLLKGNIETFCRCKLSYWHSAQGNKVNQQNYVANTWHSSTI
jgi:DNA mismatch repair protein MSH6